MKNFSFILLSSLIVLFSCDKIDDPFPPVIDVIDTGIVWDDSVFSVENNGLRFVLMEEFTGHTCTNCPAGADEVERLNAKFGDQFIPIAIHATSFARPNPGYCGIPGSDCFSSDYRTEAGDEYVAPLGITALPGGLVSRTTGQLPITGWQNEAEKWIGKAAIANIDVANFFDDSTKTFQVRISIEWLQDHTGDLNLQVQLLEDSIVDWQQDEREFPNTTYVENYMHRHMFRGDLNGIWGEQLDAAVTNELTEIVYTREFDPESVGYKLEHMSIIAFIYKRGGPVYEVMQVNEAHLTSH